jgi:hypothetical protein
MKTRAWKAARLAFFWYGLVKMVAGKEIDDVEAGVEVVVVEETGLPHSLQAAS